MLEKIINQKSKSNIAYKYNNESISYDELISLSKYYGDLLKREGNSPVIIYGHKSINTFISIFSCIESNRTYIPIDTFTPANRLQEIINLSGSTLLLTDELISVANINCMKLIELNKYKNNQINKNNNNSIAYIIFTSGSSGIPKGVRISYKSLLNFIEWISNLEYLNINIIHNVLNQSSFSFDLSVADIFFSIHNGHTIISLDRRTQNDYNKMFELIKKEKINLLVVTPSFIKLCLMNDEFNSDNYSELNTIYFCGEQLECNLVKKVFNRFSKINIINAYGPTEATSAVSSIKITENMLEDELLPVGYIPNNATKITIENDEIVLEGKSLFDGYLGNQENIIKYKTGDIGYILDNRLYCKGRRDNQIKYKGYRIELDDIKNNIYKIEYISDCEVVPVYSNEGIIKTIKAFIVVSGKHNQVEIKAELEKRLPDYMIPKSIIIIDKMPINNNGKIDKRRLMEL